ncbi:fungal-specific transcription factor domain-containing protein [Ilyonectria robusta]|uniref:fungal-specific transcription factor domain-containing protein n=1 Tax=Ilyonectria robusta TaxID=1079257 RepID=UPI001E8D619D|nr:fungal-specific transcription factor domain-containing protein [Ilyonectria robusta]KAH8650766.1 fungal-specific transcription factor domain-containing protein [Ilyonectria robusta]
MSLAIVQENSATISAPAMSKPASRRRRSKCSVACVHCRLRKVKCPGSFLSFCSKSGIEWVTLKTGVPDFDQLATRLMADVGHCFRCQSRACPLREPEPNETTAWLYTQSYFEDTSDVVLGVVSRSWFQDKLRLHFNNNNSSSSSPGPGTMDDPAWYALRNTIYAYGARQLLAKQSKPRAFSDAIELGNRYFQNALSMHSDLLFLGTSRLAVQALAVMTHYTEGVSWPSLNYMLCSSAMRLAETKGLHRQPPLSANLHDAEIYSRSCTWWGIYCYDRYSAVRLGRPLGTDDDSITVQLPRNLSPENPAQYEAMLCGIRTAQLSSAILRRLNKFDHRKPSVEEIANTMGELKQLLADLRASFPSYVSPGDSSPCTNIPAGITINDVLFLVFSYHISVIQVHSILVYPWNIAKLGLNAAEQTQLQTNIAESSRKCVESARQILQQLGGITIMPSTPKWLAFFFPLTALIDVFIHVLQNPQESSVESDIVLMRIAAGHFSYLEFTIPEFSFPLTRDLPNLAQVAVRRSREKCPAPIDIGPPPPSDLSGASADMGETTHFEVGLFPAGFNIWSEDWSTFLTSTDL